VAALKKEALGEVLPIGKGKIGSRRLRGVLDWLEIHVENMWCIAFF
jgi:hypothetical protein